MQEHFLLRSLFENLLIHNKTLSDIFKEIYESLSYPVKLCYVVQKSGSRERGAGFTSSHFRFTFCEVVKHDPDEYTIDNLGIIW